ncbi:MAG: O-antigen ligase family protein [Blastocatellia bacterium]|nr:O-antigen ligase family protein [Blastocatellia bacterium]
MIALLLLMVVSLGFMRPNVGIGGFRIQATEILFIFTAGIFAVACLTRSAAFRPNRFHFLICLYFISLFASAAFSISPGFSFVKLSGEAYLLGLAILFASVIRSTRSLQIVVLTWVATGTLVSVIGIFAIVGFYITPESFLVKPFLHHYGSLIPGPYPRVQSTFFYPAMLCSYLTVSIIFVLVSARAQFLSRKAAAVIFALHLITLAFTITPGLGGAALGICFWAAILFRRRKVLAYASITAGILGAIAFLIVATFSFRPSETSPYFYTFFDTRFDPSLRLLAWQDTLLTFIEFPIVGKGLGLGVCHVPYTAPSGARHLFTDAHQMWLNIAGQSGMLGVLSFSVLCGWVVKVTMPWDAGHDRGSVIRTGLGVAFVASFMVQGLVGSLENARHAWVLIGMIAALRYMPEEEAK